MKHKTFVLKGKEIKFDIFNSFVYNKHMGISSLNRKKIIKYMILKDGSVTVRETSEILKVSEVTVRKYLEELEKENFLLRTYGGAVLKSVPFSGEFFFGEKTKKSLHEKHKIAQKAFSLINQGETIFLDTGTTVYELSKLIRQSDKSLVVATNSLPVVSELSQNSKIKVFAIGGFLRHELLDFSSTHVIEQIKFLNFCQSFMGVDGISFSKGLTTTDPLTALIEEAIMDKSSVINILADSTKIGRISLIPYGNLQERQQEKRIITSVKASSAELGRIEKAFSFKIIKN